MSRPLRACARMSAHRGAERRRGAGLLRRRRCVNGAPRRRRAARAPGAAAPSNSGWQQNCASIMRRLSAAVRAASRDEQRSTAVLRDRRRVSMRTGSTLRRGGEHAFAAPGRSAARARRGRRASAPSCSSRHQRRNDVALRSSGARRCRACARSACTSSPRCCERRAARRASPPAPAQLTILGAQLDQIVLERCSSFRYCSPCPS